VSGNPADAAYLATLVFEVSPTQRYCGGPCGEQRPTAVIGCIDANSGGGFDIRWCRDCIVRQRARVRALMASRLV
jgi:hypothetical protein